MSKKILVSGYFGYNNIGDEAILKGLVDGIREISDAELVILSKNPDFTSKKYKVKSVDRSNLFTIIKETAKSDMVMLGGGSLLQDITSKKSILYYLTILIIAMVFRKKTFLYSQGIGPIRLKRNRLLTKWILSRVDFINVRDNQSNRELKELGIEKDVLVTTDTVFGIKDIDKSRGREILKGLGLEEGKKNICFIVINWKNYGQETVEKISNSLEMIFEKRNDINIIFLPFFYHLDLAIERKIYNKLKDKHKNLYILEDYLHVVDYLSIIENMDIVVSMRLHGLIFSTLMGAYPIGISYDPKIDGFMKELDRVQRHYVEDFKEEEVANEVLYAIDNLDKLKKQTGMHLEKFYKLTSKHNQALVKELSK